MSTPRLRWHQTTMRGQVAFFGDAGEGHPLVFIHGWGLSSRTYARMLPVLVRAGVRVVAPALPGFGRSDALPGRYSFERLASWMNDLLDHAGVEEPAFLIGHSFGGGVATALAYHFPERARSLTLVNAVGGAVWTPQDEERHIKERPIWHWALDFRRDLKYMDPRKVLPVVARDFVGNALRNPRALRLAANLARTADLRDELAAVADRGVPVTVLWGDQDKVIPSATFAATCDAAGTQGDVVADAGHSWLLDDPEAFGEIITNSLTVHAMLSRRRARIAGESAQQAGPAA